MSTMTCYRCPGTVLPCPDRRDTGSCWYWNCHGRIHANGVHPCADKDGDAQPGAVA